MKKIFTFLFLWLVFCLAYNLAEALPYRSYKKDKCEWYGKASLRLVVHHIEPQHLRPDLANDHPENYITLCDPIILRSSGCHYKLGHRGKSWSYDNSDMLKIIIEKLKREQGGVKE